MATGHRVKTFWEPKPRQFVRELEPVSSRRYRDRWGVEYDVIWNDQKYDRPLTGDYPRAAST